MFKKLNCFHNKMSIKNNLRLITVEPVLFFSMFCTFMSMPILQQLVYRKICDVEFNDTICQNLTHAEQNIVQKKTSNWIIYQSTAFTLSSIFSCLVLGSWSDSVGRKAIMILPPIGSALMSVNHLLNIHFFSLDVNYLLIGVIVSGLFGGFATTLSAVFSYMSDITDKNNRTLRIGILESMVFLGAGCGELIAGVLLDKAGFMAAFSVVLGVNVCIALYIGLVLQESYYPQADVPLSNTILKVHKHVIHVWSVLFKPRSDNQRMYLLVVLFGAFSVLLINFGGFNDVSLLYVMKEPLHFSSSYIGYFLAEVQFLRGLGVIVGMPIMKRILKLSDPIIIIIGMILSCIMFVFYGFSTHDWMMFAGGLLAVGGGLPVPCMRSIMSKCVQPNEQGSMFAGVACLEVLYTLIASLIFNNLYSATVSWMPGFSFFLLAGLLIIPIIVNLWLYSRMKLGSQYRAMDDNEDAHDTTTVQNEAGINNDPSKTVSC